MLQEEVVQRLDHFESAIWSYHISRRGIPNISRYQATLLQSIRSNEDIIVINADKNLGPVAIDTSETIRRALDEHLLDTSTYVQVPKDEADKAISDLNCAIFKWTRVHGIMAEVSLGACQYIRHHTSKNRNDPYGYFYLLAKIHKSPMTTRPVCSDCASIVHPLGKWLICVLSGFVFIETRIE